MIRDLIDWFAELGRIEHFGYLALGWATAWGWQGGKAWMRNRTFGIQWRRLGLMGCVAVIVFVTLSTYQNSQCVREFNEVIKTRSEVTASNDALSIEQRLIIYRWIHALVFPPPDMAPLPNDDPRRQQWAVQLTLDADAAFTSSIEQQRRNDEVRRENPLPNATCAS